jgi:protein-S-isoprenylcysteine O-methyltransferase Ste14
MLLLRALSAFLVLPVVVAGGDYLLILMVGFHLRVVRHEEPGLRRQFGAEWEDYASRVSRWLPHRSRRSK